MAKTGFSAEAEPKITLGKYYLEVQIFTSNGNNSGEGKPHNTWTILAHPVSMASSANFIGYFSHINIDLFH